MRFLIYLKMHVICGGSITNCARMRGNAMVCKMYTQTCSHIRVTPVYNLPFCWNRMPNCTRRWFIAFNWRAIEIAKQLPQIILRYELQTKFSQLYVNFNSFNFIVYERVIRAIKYFCKQKILSKALRHDQINQVVLVISYHYFKCKLM